jgi:formate hydrogenlyase transcriptional activator
MDSTQLQDADVTSASLLDELLASKDELQLLIDTIPGFIWCAQPDGSMECLNGQFYEYTGLSQDEPPGRAWESFVHPDDLERVSSYWKAHRSGEPAEIEFRLRRFDGEYRWFLVRAVAKYDRQGRIVRWYGINIDIEARKRAEEKIHEDERELRRITDAIPQLINILAPDGSTLHANQSVLEYTGLTSDHVEPANFRERIFHQDDVVGLRFERQRALVRGVPFELEQRMRRKDGKYRWFLIQYSPLLNEKGQITRWYATATDIDQRKRAEEELQRENLALRDEITRSSRFEEIIGSSAPLRRVLTQLEKVASSNSTVLILGETGTGKELIARAIHERSNRSTRAFIRVNCAAIPGSLVASELFGHEKGAFTGALQRRLGRFELANGGTIFLDEIGDLPAETQIALLRVLQEREFERVGSSQPISVDVRVIAATHRDLKADVIAGKFRQDLFYRLNVFPIQVPPLRDRRDDIPLLLNYFIERYAKTAGTKVKSIRKHTIELLQSYDWPGNIRELQNVIERAILLSEGGELMVDAAWLKRDFPQVNEDAAGSLAASLEDGERRIIEAALEECAGQVAGPQGAAAKLGMPRQTLDSRIASLRIDKRRFRTP